MQPLNWMGPPAPAGGPTQTSYSRTDHLELPFLVALRSARRRLKSSAKAGDNGWSDALVQAFSRHLLAPTTLLPGSDIVYPALYRAVVPVFQLLSICIISPTQCCSRKTLAEGRLDGVGAIHPLADTSAAL